MNCPRFAFLGLAVMSLHFSGAALGWNAGSDERRRQMTINQINQDAADRARRASQPFFGGSQYTPSPSSRGDGGGTYHAAPSSGSGLDGSLDAISRSLADYEKQRQKDQSRVTSQTITRTESPEQLAARIRAGAEGGDAFMQWTLGRMYNSGVGVASNPAEAVRWFRAAAAQGDADGQASLGDMYYAGNGVAKDVSAAVAWWVKAARSGHGVGAKNAGACYESGWGVARSNDLAREFYKIAADTREPEAALWLGEMYRDGKFGSKDMAAACPLFKIAAEQGLLLAEDSYSKCFPNDTAATLLWLRKAADGGLSRSRFLLG